MQQEKAAADAYKEASLPKPVSSGTALVKATIETTGKEDMSFEADVNPDESDKTAADITSTAPEQRRILTSVRKALEETGEDGDGTSGLEITVPEAVSLNSDFLF